MWFSPNQSTEAISRGIFSLHCIKMPIIFCLKLLISESLGERLPRHIWLDCFFEDSSQTWRSEDSFCAFFLVAQSQSQPTDPTIEANSKAQALSPQQLEVIKERKFHAPQAMPCTLTILSGLTPSALASQMSSVSFWQVLPWIFGHHVQQGTQIGHEQGSNLPRAVGVIGLSAGSFTRQRFSFVCFLLQYLLGSTQNPQTFQLVSPQQRCQYLPGCHKDTGSLTIQEMWTL